jgi:hypothetical protein
VLEASRKCEPNLPKREVGDDGMTLLFDRFWNLLERDGIFEGATRYHSLTVETNNLKQTLGLPFGKPHALLTEISRIG